jgi:hypothetical protein
MTAVLPSSADFWRRRHLLAEPHKRKVLIVENALLPQPVKSLMAEILMHNLEVRTTSLISD